MREYGLLRGPHVVLLPKFGSAEELERKVHEHEAFMQLPENQERERRLPEHLRFKK